MNTTYAGFWLRFVAYIIDAIIIYIVQSFVFIPIFAAFGLSFASQLDGAESMTDAEAVGMVASMMGMAGATALLGIAISVAASAAILRSRWMPVILITFEAAGSERTIFRTSGHCVVAVTCSVQIHGTAE